MTVAPAVSNGRRAFLSHLCIQHEQPWLPDCSGNPGGRRGSCLSPCRQRDEGLSELQTAREASLGRDTAAFLGKASCTAGLLSLAGTPQGGGCDVSTVWSQFREHWPRIMS